MAYMARAFMMNALFLSVEAEAGPVPQRGGCLLHSSEFSTHHLDGGIVELLVPA